MELKREQETWTQQLMKMGNRPWKKTSQEQDCYHIPSGELWNQKTTNSCRIQLAEPAADADAVGDSCCTRSQSLSFAVAAADVEGMNSDEGMKRQQQSLPAAQQSSGAAAAAVADAAADVTVGCCQMAVAAAVLTAT